MANQVNGSDWVEPKSGGTSETNPLSMDYHMKQWNEPKESTKAFSKFFSNELSMSKSIIDIGAGAGAATYYLASRNLQADFIGIDYSNEIIDIAKKNFKRI
jgi:tRNA G46 methylase TrmB